MLLSQDAKSRKRTPVHSDVLGVLRPGVGTLRGFGFFIVLVLGATLCASAQSLPIGTAHQVTLSGTAPSPIGGSGIIAGYNVYKSIAGAAYVKINTALLATPNYIDTAVTAGQNLSYCMSTVDSKNQESVCSAASSVTIPANPNPPTITIMSVSINISGSTETVVAKWTNTSGAGQHFSFSDGKNFVGQGLIAPAIGTFAEEITAPVGTVITFAVDDAAGAYASQQAI